MDTSNFRSLMVNKSNDDGISKQIGAFEKTFLEWLVNMHNTLRKDVIKIDEVETLAKVLMHMREENQNDYLDSLIRPEMTKGSKIPTTIPIPSSSFQMHNSITFAPNTLGHAALVYNPFFLSTNTGATPLSTLYLNNNSTLTGNASSNFFIAQDIGQTIPGVYNEYRLVSASIVIRYIGRLDIVQGVIGGAIVFDNGATSSLADGTTINASLQKYGNFNLAQDSFYFQENMTLQGIRELYFPLDSTFEQYRRLGATENDPKTGFAYVIYLQDGVSQGSSQNYKIDIYSNYECLPDAAFLNYIPTSTGPGSRDDSKKTDAVRFVQSSAITTGEIPRSSNLSKGPSFWESIKSTLGSVIPSIASLASSFFPGAKLVGPIASALGGMLGSTPGNNSNNVSFLNPGSRSMMNGGNGGANEKSFFNDSMMKD